MVVEQRWRRRLTHVPHDIIGQHAKEHMGAHSSGWAVLDRADFKVGRLDRAEGAFHMGKALYVNTVAVLSSSALATLVRTT
jgi:hypothetical protein